MEVLGNFFSRRGTNIPYMTEEMPHQEEFVGAPYKLQELNGAYAND